MNFYLQCSLLFILINTILVHYANASSKDKINSQKKNGLKLFSQNSNKFSNRLFKIISHQNQGNIVCSPLSVRLVLLMAYHGSKEKTLEELRSALMVSSTEPILKHGVKALLESLNHAPGVNLTLANKIFLRKDLHILSQFQETVSEFYNSATDKADFEKPDEAVKNINNWVADQTKDRIKEILSSSDLDNDPLMVLVNAVYFYGTWAQSFDEELTHDAPFYLSNNQTVNVKMMQTTDDFNWGIIPHIRAKYIELPYAHSDLSKAVSMYIIVPQGNLQLSLITSKLQNIDFTQLVSMPQETEVHIPKFKIENKHDLIPHLKMMGINEAFENSAMFNNIIENEVLKITTVVQKAFIEVNEKGTEAAGTGAVGLSLRGAFDEVSVFKVDSPFFCVIFDKHTQTQLFMAQVIDPTQHQ